MGIHEYLTDIKVLIFCAQILWKTSVQLPVITHKLRIKFVLMFWLRIRQTSSTSAIPKLPT